MMSVVEALEYNRWANERLYAACAGLGDELLDVRPAGISGTVRELLLHIAGGQQTFVLRTMGRQHEGELGRRSAWPGLAEVQRVALATSDELIGIATVLDDAADVDLAYVGETYRFPVRFFLVHALEHGMEHRTEVKVALAALGVETPDLDGWAFAAAMGYGTRG
jgi:uncharacterized damage-inducible protein DinB